MNKLLLLLFILIPSIAQSASYEITTAGNNLGIGSVTPGVALDVQGTVRASHFSGILASDVPTLNQNTTGSAASVTTGAQPAITSVGNLSGLVVTGNVGIGSTAPGQALDIQGTVRTIGLSVNGKQPCLQDGTTCPTNSATSAGGLNAVQYAAAGSTFAGMEQKFSFNGTNVGVGTTNGRALLEVTTGNLYMNGGNVGVGSLSPGQLIDVQGNVRATAYYGSGANLTGIGGSISGLTTGDFIKAASSTTIANSAVMNEVSGNVGLGSATPGQILDVQGSIRASQMVIIGNGASAYVGGVGANIGIGTFASQQVLAPAQTLDVQGTIKGIYPYIGVLAPTVTVVTAGATPAISVTNNNGTVYSITGLNTAITSMTTNLTGTPTNGAIMEIQFTDAGTGEGITWGASFASSTVSLPSTTVSSTLLSVFLQYNSTSGKWVCVGTA